MTFNHNPKHNTNLLQKTGRNFGLDSAHVRSVRLGASP